MNKILKGDYFIVGQDRGRDYLARALSDSDSTTVEAVVEEKQHIQGLRNTLTVTKKNVIINLGSQPRHGKVYGIDVTNLFYVKKTHDDFGVINFFYKPEKQVVKDLWEAMDKTAKILKKWGLEFLLRDIIWEVLPFHKQKFAGMFIKSKKENVPDRIQILPEIMPATEYVYVLLHEIGHHLDLNFLKSKKLKAQWLRLFNTSIRVVSVKKDVSQSLLDNLMAGEEMPSDYKSGLDEDDALAFKWIVRTIGQVNALTIKDLDTLFEAEMKDDIKKLWPVRNIPRKELAPIISEYATKNVKECFSEAFAFHLVKRKLPEQVVKLVERSISYAKANKEGDE